jgi:hypothetical protein
LLVNWTVSVNPVSTVPFGFRAVTVKLKGTPAVAGDGKPLRERDGVATGFRRSAG